MKEPGKYRLSVTVDDKIVRVAMSRARAEHLTLSAYLNQMLYKYLLSTQKEENPT